VGQAAQHEQQRQQDQCCRVRQEKGMGVTVRSHGIGELLQVRDLIHHRLSDIEPTQTVSDLRWIRLPNRIDVIPDTGNHVPVSNPGKGCIYLILVCP
jgi:hypothetical protein